ncbi:MAG: orotate phosphoribosyltransferase [Dehalococcoidia bacterium]
MTREDIEQLRPLMHGCFKYDGPYTLSSGRQSKYYYDGKGATQDPPTACLIGNALVDVILASEAEAVGGLEIGAIPIADAVGIAAHVSRGVRLPTFIVRKQPKGHGTQSQVSQANLPDGDILLKPGRRVAIVDDVITTGGSIQQAIDVVRGLGCVVTMVVALVERHESGGTALRGQGFPVLRLFYTDEEGRLFIDDDVVRTAAESAGSGLLRR